MKPIDVFFVIVVLFILGVFAIGDPLPPSPKDIYCEMVATFKQTGGKYGWPDYRRNYDTACAGGAP